MLRFASYLSPNIYDTYASIARYVGNVTGLPTTLTVGQSFDEIGAGQVDIAFMCGLPYATMADSLACPFELLAAPVLLGERYQHRPIYFSDVIVRQESPYTSFDDLEGCTWAYNQLESHSGWNMVYHSLLERGKTPRYFDQLIANRLPPALDFTRSRRPSRCRRHRFARARRVPCQQPGYRTFPARHCHVGTLQRSTRGYRQDSESRTETPHTSRAAVYA